MYSEVIIKDPVLEIEYELNEILDKEGLDGLPLYKILPRKHLDSFTRQGFFLVRRLYEFQHIESDGRRDDMEGLAERELSGEEILDHSNIDWPLENYRRALGLNAGVRMEDVDFESGKVVLDASRCLAFCLTSHPTKRLVHKFSDPDSPAAIVKISNPVCFKKCLDEAVCSHFGCEPSVIGGVQYVGRDVNSAIWTKRMHPALVKPSSYRDENEWRFLWKIPKENWYHNKLTADRYLWNQKWEDVEKRIQEMPLCVLRNKKIRKYTKWMPNNIKYRIPVANVSQNMKPSDIQDKTVMYAPKTRG